MADKTWKKVERKVAELLGGERVPVTGRFRGSAPDVTHKFLSLEVKHRDSLPGWILEAMEQADAANNGKQVSTVILHQKGMKFTDSLTVMRLSDTIAMLAKIATLEQLLSDKRTEEES